MREEMIARQARTFSRTGDAPSRSTTRVLDSERLFGSQKEIQIRHAGQMYRLRITRNGKLILNK